MAMIAPAVTIARAAPRRRHQPASPPVEPRGEREHGREPREDDQVRADAEEADAADRRHGDGEDGSEPDACGGEPEEEQVGEPARAAPERPRQREQRAGDERGETPARDRDPEEHAVAAPHDGIAVDDAAEVAEARVAAVLRESLVHDERDHAQRRARERDDECDTMTSGAGAHRARDRV
jgi:hypothetical protein